MTAADRDEAEARAFARWLAGEARRRCPRSPAPSAVLSTPRRSRAGDRPLPRCGASAVSVAIIDYGSGNLHSAAKAFERAAREAGLDRAIAVTSDPDARAPGRPDRAAGRRRLRRLPPRPRCGARHGRGAAARRVHEDKPSFPRHLRRHAAHGDPRPRTRHEPGPRLDPRRREGDRAERPVAQDPAYGLEHARTGEARTRCSTASHRAGRAARLFRAFLRAARLAIHERRGRHRRLRRPGHRHRRRGTISPARNSIPRRARRSASSSSPIS